MRFNLKKRQVFFQVPPYKKRFYASLIAVGIFLMTMLGSFYVVDFRIRPTLVQMARVKAQKIAIQAINESIRSNISPDIQYQNLMRIQFNSEGKVTFIQPNTGEINRISSEATLAVQKRLKDLPKEEVQIPLWQIFGSRIMAGTGPDIPVKIIPLGFVESAINDHFDQAGINQTRHRIFVRIKVTVKVIVPLVTEEVQVFSDIPLAEAVIVGDVPEVYVGNGGVILPGAKGNSGK